MSRILITNGDYAFNQSLISYHLRKGHRTLVLFASGHNERLYRDTLPQEQKDFYEGMTRGDFLSAAEEEFADVDVCIHGDEEFNEQELFLREPIRFPAQIAEIFEDIFHINKKMCRIMLKKKRGAILFPVIYDALYYAGYPSSPVLNQGKLSLMKCLSRELTAFKITVNALTFGYYEPDRGKEPHDRGKEPYDKDKEPYDKDKEPHNKDREHKKEMNKKLEIFGLKTKTRPLEDFLAAFEQILCITRTSRIISGQNIHLGIGIETAL